MYLCICYYSNLLLGPYIEIGVLYRKSLIDSFAAKIVGARIIKVFEGSFNSLIGIVFFFLAKDWPNSSIKSGNLLEQGPGSLEGVGEMTIQFLMTIQHYVTRSRSDYGDGS